jgi:hypothetical protein
LAATIRNEFELAFCSARVRRADCIVGTYYWDRVAVDTFIMEDVMIENLLIAILAIVLATFIWEMLIR